MKESSILIASTPKILVDTKTDYRTKSRISNYKRRHEEAELFYAERKYNRVEYSQRNLSYISKKPTAFSFENSEFISRIAHRNIGVRSSSIDFIE